MKGILHVLGPSGCGKSTTLRCLVGFIDAASGRITVNDEDITYADPEKGNRNSVSIFMHFSQQ